MKPAFQTKEMLFADFDSIWSSRSLTVLFGDRPDSLDMLCAPRASI